MARSVLSGVDWVVATVAPNIVAPHPNFSIDRVAPVELLALLGDGRLTDYRRYTESSEAGPSPEDRHRHAVSAVWDSLMTKTQETGINELLKLTASKDFLLGERAAMAMFAAVGLSELDRPEDALNAIDNVLINLVEVGPGNGSIALIEAALRQQRVLRLVEASRWDEALKEAHNVEETAREARADFESFPTSKGVAWTARQAQLEISAVLSANALRARSMLEGMNSRLWVEVVRRRPLRSDSRAARMVANSGTSFLKKAFEGRYSWTAHRRRFAAGDPADMQASSALLHAELCGNWGAVKEGRELLGRIRALSNESEDWSVIEAIRLLRQADAREPLEDLLRWVRSQGPTEALLTAARSVLTRPTLTSAVTRSDLAVLGAAGDLLKPDELASALLAAKHYRTNPTGRLSRERLVNWAVQEASWRSVARLLPGSGHDEPVAEELRESIGHTAETTEPILRAVRLVVEAIDWEAVSTEEKRQWREWAGQLEGDDYALALTVLDAVEGVRRHEAEVPRPTGMELALRIVWEHAHGIRPESEELSQAVETCTASLLEIRTSASAGRFGFGGVSSAEVSVALIASLQQTQLWDSLSSFLTDPLVASEDKSPAFDRLAAERPVISAKLNDLFSASIDTLLANSRTFGLDDTLAISAGGLRFVSAYRLLPRADVIRGISQLAGSGGHAGKVEAARTVRIAIGEDSDAEWAAVLLLQLTHEGDPVVRAEAARTLAEMRSRFKNIVSTVDQRLLELIQEDGLLVPLLALRGVSLSRTVPAALAQAVTELAKNHPARSVRELATTTRKQPQENRS